MKFVMNVWDANEFPAELDGTQFLENSIQLIQHSLLSWLFPENVSADISFREVLLFVSNSPFLKILRLLQPMQLCQQNIWYISRLDFGLFKCKKSTFWLHFLFSNCSRHGHARLEEQLRTYSSHIRTQNSDCQIASTLFSMVRDFREPPHAIPFLLYSYKLLMHISFRL